MARSFIIAGVVVLSAMGCAVSPVAQAQKLGTYGGQLADGSPFAISVSRFRGQTFVSEIETQVMQTCKHGVVINEGFFAAGFLAPITQNPTIVSFSDGTEYYGVSLTFDNETRSVSGFALQKYVRLAPGSGRPTSAFVCSVPNQAYAAVLDAKAAFDPNLPITKLAD